MAEVGSKNHPFWYGKQVPLHNGGLFRRRNKPQRYPTATSPGRIPSSSRRSLPNPSRPPSAPPHRPHRPAPHAFLRTPSPAIQPAIQPAVSPPPPPPGHFTNEEPACLLLLLLRKSPQNPASVLAQPRTDRAPARTAPELHTGCASGSSKQAKQASKRLGRASHRARAPCNCTARARAQQDQAQAGYVKS